LKFASNAQFAGATSAQSLLTLLEHAVQVCMLTLAKIVLKKLAKQRSKAEPDVYFSGRNQKGEQEWD
jgi:hypothetical protein